MRTYEVKVKTEADSNLLNLRQLEGVKIIELDRHDEEGYAIYRIETTIDLKQELDLMGGIFEYQAGEPKPNTLVSIDPTTGATIQEYLQLTPETVNKIIEEVDTVYHDWRKVDFASRAGYLRQAAQLLRDNAAEYAELMAHEMGKPVTDGRAEAEKCAWVCDYYADNGEGFLQPEMIETDANKSYVTYQPLGVILAIMPWNFPFWQVFRFAAPALMAGNVALLKHAPNMSGCAMAIEEIFCQTGFPDNVFRTLLIDTNQVEAILENPLVKAVTLTGSVAAGQAVAQKAGALVKKSVLELGGSDPYLILADADLEAAVETCVASRLINSGQSCIAAKRFVVDESVRQQFEAKVIKQMAAVKMGNPFNEETEIGPQARYDLRDDLHRQVRESIAQGATCLLGGQIPADQGAFYPPTVLTDVRPGMPAYSEELFGPVATIISVKDEAEAIRVANDSTYGLGAAVFTSDVTKGERLATEELEAGCCFVNTFVKSDPRLPFGGIKASGYGRELSHHGIKEFVNIKTVYVK